MLKLVFYTIIQFFLLLQTVGQSRNPFDSNYVASYNDKFVVSLFQTYRQLNYNFKELFPGDTTNFPTNSQFIAHSQQATGISLSYDKLSISLAVTTPATTFEKQKFGETRYTNLGFSITSNTHRIELAYRSYTGFYDGQTAARDTTWNDTTSVYFQRPNMSSWLVKVKGFYFFNAKKFSYGSAYVNNYRQLKTNGSWFLMGDVYYHEIFSSDYILPRELTASWQNLSNINVLNFYGINFGGGYSFNLVLFKKLYLNLLLGATLNIQHRYFSTIDGLVAKGDWKFGLNGGDLRGALGINAKNFFISISGGLDKVQYKWTNFTVESLLVNTYFNIGYRFKIKEKQWIKKMKNSKLYNLI